MHRTTQTDTRWLDLDQLNCVIYTWFVQSRYSLGFEVCIHHYRDTAVYRGPRRQGPNMYVAIQLLCMCWNFSAIGDFTRSFTPDGKFRDKSASRTQVRYFSLFPYSTCLLSVSVAHVLNWIVCCVRLKCCIIVVRREHNQYLVFGVSLPPVYLHCSPKQYDSKGISQYEWDWSFNVITVTHTFSYEKVAYG